MGALRNLRFGVLLLAIAIALFLWGVANGSSSVEVAYDIPVVLSGLKGKFVVTEVSVSDVNVRVRGSRAALRNIDPKDLAYEVDASSGRKGLNEFEVEASLVPVPRGVKVVSRSPAVISANFERSGRKAVGVRADLEGSPATGFRVAGWAVDPPRIWLAGARSEVLRVSEVLTAAIDVTGLDEDFEREVRLSLGGGNVWMEDDKLQVNVAVRIEPDPEAQTVGAAEPIAGAAETEDAQGVTAPEGAG